MAPRAGIGETLDPRILPQGARCKPPIASAARQLCGQTHEHAVTSRATPICSRVGVAVVPRVPRWVLREVPRVVSTRTRSSASRQERLPTPLRNLRRLRGDPETSHLLRPTAGHRDPSRPYPSGLSIAHIHPAEAAEVLLGLDERTVGEQWRATRRIDTEHRGSVVQAASEY